MLHQPTSLRTGIGACRRLFAATAIKFDLSRPNFPPSASPSAAPSNFSHAATASKILAMQLQHQQQRQRVQASAQAVPVSFAHSLPPVIEAIASKCSQRGDAAVIELPCSSDIFDAIAQSPLKISTLGAGPDWHVGSSVRHVAQAAAGRTSLIVLQSVNAATGMARPANFFASLLRELDLLRPSRPPLLLVDDSYSAHCDAWADDSAGRDNVAFVADMGAAMGAPGRCCIIRGQDPVLHSAAVNHPLQPSSLAVLDRRFAVPSAASTDLLRKNTAMFRAWMQRESGRLCWSDTGLTSSCAPVFVSIAPGVELDSRRFYAELERRGSTRVGRGSEWAVDDSSFRIILGNVDTDVLQQGLQAISTALDIWASTDSNLGLGTIY